MKYDILIKNGAIFDGSGKEALTSSLAVKNGKICKIGNDIFDKEASTVIDAKGKYVTPGFIDINNSADHYLGIINNSGCWNLISQGITTIIMGHCGASLAPLIKGNLNFLNHWSSDINFNVNWDYVDEYLAYLQSLKPGVNVGTLIGWNTIRENTVGKEFKPLTDEELRSCLFLLKKSLQDGGLGVSFGLAYPNQKVVGSKEIIEAIKIVKKYDGLVSFHLRNESENILEAVEEVIEIAKNTKANIEIVHLKAYGQDNWSLYPMVLAKIQEANESFHTNINFDIYPYELTAESLFLLLPEWLTIGDENALRRNLENKDVRKNLLKILKEKKKLYENMFFVSSASDFMFGGKTLKQIAKEFNLSLEETLLKIIFLKPKELIVYNLAVSIENIIYSLKSPYCIVSSNSTSHNPDTIYSDRFIHPRAFGTFPKLFKNYVKDQPILSFALAIHKCTGLPAKKLGLKKKGIIKLENDADIVIWDPETIEDMSSDKNPSINPKGIETVIINGKISFNKGQVVNQGLGKILTLF